MFHWLDNPIQIGYIILTSDSGSPKYHVFCFASVFSIPQSHFQEARSETRRVRGAFVLALGLDPISPDDTTLAYIRDSLANDSTSQPLKTLLLTLRDKVF